MKDAGGRTRPRTALRRARLLAVALTVILVAVSAGLAAAQEAQPDASEGTLLRIGTKEAPPFAIKAEDGRWEGISIDLLEAMAQRMGFRYELVETSLAGMVDDVAEGTLDASIAAMSVTEEREKVIDFSNPYYHSGLGVAVSVKQRATLLAVIDALGSRAFLVTLGTLMVLLLVVGALMWLAERWRNGTEFERNPAKGLFSGVWWAAVTMTTVGYGDKTPVTFLGRILGIVWMFSALILTSLVIAQLSASLTAERIQSRVHTVSDLAKVRIGSVAGASSMAALQGIGARPVRFPDVQAGLTALAAGRIEAFVHDEPILRWLQDSVEGVAIAPVHFAPENYAIVLPQDSPHREAINLALLDVMTSNRWTMTLQYYLGADQ